MVLIGSPSCPGWPQAEQGTGQAALAVWTKESSKCKASFLFSSSPPPTPGWAASNTPRSVHLLGRSPGGLVSVVQTRRSPSGHHSSLAQWLPQTHFTPVLLFLLLQPIPSSLFPLPPSDDWLMSLSGSSSQVKAIAGTCRVSRQVTWQRKVCRQDCPMGQPSCTAATAGVGGPPFNGLSAVGWWPCAPLCSDHGLWHAYCWDCKCVNTIS